MLTLLAITIVVIGFLMAIMAVGVVLQNKSLRGSCGGSEVFDCDGDAITCGACPNRNKKKKEPEHLPGGAFREFIAPGR